MKVLKTAGETASAVVLLTVGVVCGAMLLHVLKVPNYASFIIGALAGTLAMAVLRGDDS